jgi:hypothetical protein
VAAEAATRAANEGTSVEHAASWALCLTVAAARCSTPLHAEGVGRAASRGTAPLSSSIALSEEDETPTVSPPLGIPSPESLSPSDPGGIDWKVMIRDAASAFGNWFDYSIPSVRASAAAAVSSPPERDPQLLRDDLSASARSLLVTAAMRAGRLGAAWLEHRSYEEGSGDSSTMPQQAVLPPSEPPLASRPLAELAVWARELRETSGTVGAALADAARAAAVATVPDGIADSAEEMAEAAFALCGYMSDLDPTTTAAAAAVDPRGRLHRNQSQDGGGGGDDEGDVTRRLRGSIHALCSSSIQRADLASMRPLYQLQLFVALASLTGHRAPPYPGGVPDLDLDLDPTPASLALALLPGLTRWFDPLSSSPSKRRSDPKPPSTKIKPDPSSSTSAKIGRAHV